MQGDAEIIELLNEVLTAELTAVNQYFLDSRMLSNWGYERLGKKFYEESIDEMKDADHLIERVLYLDGMPNLQRLGTVRVGETAPEKLNAALDLEKEAIERLNRGIALCTAKDDNGTRELLEDILEGEEHHADWLESQLELISQVGEAHYLAQQIPRLTRGGFGRGGNGQVCPMITLLFRRIGFMAIGSYLWQHRGSAVRTVDFGRRLPHLLQTGRARDALTEAKAIIALDSRVPTRTDVRITGYEDGTLMLRGDIPVEQLEEARAKLLAVGDVVDVRTTPVVQTTLDDALARVS